MLGQWCNRCDSSCSGSTSQAAPLSALTVHYALVPGLGSAKRHALPFVHWTYWRRPDSMPSGVVLEATVYHAATLTAAVVTLPC